MVNCQRRRPTDCKTPNFCWHQTQSRGNLNLEVRRCEMLTLIPSHPRFMLLLINARLVAVQLR